MDSKLSSEITDFTVDSIVGSRIRNEKTFYLLKWVGFNDAHNSWESEENLRCPKKLDEFLLREKMAAWEAERADKKRKKRRERKERQLERKGKRSRQGNVPNTSSAAGCIIPPPTSMQNTLFEDGRNMPHGFARNLEPERILNAVGSCPEDLRFIVKWKASNDTDVVPAKFVIDKYPMIVIAYYEERLAKQNDSENPALPF